MRARSEADFCVVIESETADVRVVLRYCIVIELYGMQCIIMDRKSAPCCGGFSQSHTTKHDNPTSRQADKPATQIRTPRLILRGSSLS